MQAIVSLLHTEPTLNASRESPSSSDPGLGFVLATLLYTRVSALSIVRIALPEV
jgi:hypothetical protein